MIFDIVYHEFVVRDDIPRLSKTDKERIMGAIKKKLIILPEMFGSPLQNSLKGYRKLRVGDYRIVFRIKSDVVKIFCIEHR